MKRKLFRAYQASHFTSYEGNYKKNMFTGRFTNLY